MDIVGKRKWLLLFTVICVVISLIFVVVFGLKSGIEFSSGSILTLSFESDITQAELRQALSDAGYGSSITQQTQGGDFIVRTHELTGDEKTALESTLEEKLGKVTEVEFNSVSPMIATETLRNATIAVAVAAVGILLYIAWAFRRMPSPFLYGVSAVIALMHASLISIGVFAVLGRLFNWEINLMFITGVLAVIGYSVNNTVVVFDRIRENLTRIPGDFASLVNTSLLEMLGRCLNSSITTLIAALAILVFVGSTIRNFSVVLMTGLLAGTYSSLFLAPLLLVMWEKRKEAKAGS